MLRIRDFQRDTPSAPNSFFAFTIDRSRAASSGLPVPNRRSSMKRPLGSAIMLVTENVRGRQPILIEFLC